MKIVVTSQSVVKLEAVKLCFPIDTIVGCISSSQLPAQPINSGLRCAHRRIDGIPHDKADMIISIENGIDTIHHWQKGGDGNHYVDICYVVAQLKDGRRFEADSSGIPVPANFVKEAEMATSTNYPHRSIGYEVSAGSRIAMKFPGIDAANWTADARFGKKPRLEQICEALRKLEPSLI